MPEDNSLLSQGTVDERNEARNPLNWMYPNTVHSLELREQSPEEPTVDDDTIRDLWQAILRYHQLQDTEAINPDAEQRRQESLARARGEIARLMRS